MGLAPTTSRITTGCSNYLNYSHDTLTGVSSLRTHQVTNDTSQYYGRFSPPTPKVSQNPDYILERLNPTVSDGLRGFQWFTTGHICTFRVQTEFLTDVTAVSHVVVWAAVCAATVGTGHVYDIGTSLSPATFLRAHDVTTVILSKLYTTVTAITCQSLCVVMGVYTRCNPLLVGCLVLLHVDLLQILITRTGQYP